MPVLATFVAFVLGLAVLAVTAAAIALISFRRPSHITVLETATRFLRPDMAVVHWSWRIEGDKNPDGTSRQPRYGMMTLVAEKKNGNWRVVVGQKTNAILGIPLNFKTSRRPLRFPELPPDASFP
jgi:ketosteroid isomerase-like protein